MKKLQMLKIACLFFVVGIGFSSCIKEPPPFNNPSTKNLLVSATLSGDSTVTNASYTLLNMSDQLVVFRQFISTLRDSAYVDQITYVDSIPILSGDSTQFTITFQEPFRPVSNDLWTYGNVYFMYGYKQIVVNHYSNQ